MGKDAPTPADRLEDTRERFGFRTTSELVALPPMRWLIRGMVLVCGSVMLAADPKAGKTHALLGVAVALAVTGVWAGEPCETVASVWYCSNEGAEGLRGRLRALQDLHPGYPPEAWDRIRYGAAPVIGTRDMGMLSDLLAEEEAAWGGAMRPRVLIFDTLANCLRRADHNDNGQMADAMGEINALAKRHGCVALVAHHTKKGDGGGFSGGQQLYASVDVMLYLKLDGEGARTGRIELFGGKDTGGFPPLGYRIVPVERTFTHPDGTEETESMAYIELTGAAEKRAKPDARAARVLAATEFLVASGAYALATAKTEGEMADALGEKRTTLAEALKTAGRTLASGYDPLDTASGRQKVKVWYALYRTD